MKRIFIDAAKCDGCKNCTIACMQAHRADEGTVYTLNLQISEMNPGITLSVHLTEVTNQFSAVTVISQNV